MSKIFFFPLLVVHLGGCGLEELTEAFLSSSITLSWDSEHASEYVFEENTTFRLSATKNGELYQDLPSVNPEDPEYDIVPGDDIVLQNMPVGDYKFSLFYDRDGDQSEYSVKEARVKIKVTRKGKSITAQFSEFVEVTTDPSEPVVITPRETVVYDVTSETLTFSWESDDFIDPNYYRFVYDTNDQFDSPIVVDHGILSDAASFSCVIFLGRKEAEHFMAAATSYSWKVEGDDGNRSGESNVYHYVTPIFIPDTSLRTDIAAGLGKAYDEAIRTDDALLLTKLTSTNKKDIRDLTGLEHFTSLTVLYVHQNYISDITPLAQLVALKTLRIDDNNIGDLSALSNLTALKTLYVSSNPVQDLSALTNLVALRNLRVNNTDVNDISVVSNMPKMKNLQLKSTPVDNLSSLYGLSKLKKLYVKNCPNLDASDVQDLKAVLPKVKVYGP